MHPWGAVPNYMSTAMRGQQAGAVSRHMICVSTHIPHLASGTWQGQHATWPGSGNCSILSCSRKPQHLLHGLVDSSCQVKLEPQALVGVYAACMQAACHPVCSAGQYI